MAANPESADRVKQARFIVATHLLDWYDEHARTLPWRAPPGAAPPDPYRVWLSEIMLQQTTVAAVIPYFEKFTARWPDVAALAAASDEELMAGWAGLGYYARARNLLSCARAVVTERGGTFPDTAVDLQELPGIGPYTAAAIAAIAFGEAVPVVDTNVERVVARLFAIDRPLPGAKAEIRSATGMLTPAERPGDFAQAMMDLGATVCTVRAPACLVCPLSADCAAHATGREEELPVRPAKKARPHRTGTAWWIERDGAVLLVTRPRGGMLGGMAALPDDGWNARGDGDGIPPDGCEAGEELGVVAHVFTHFSLELRVRRATGTGPDGETRWHPIDRLDEAGLPTLFRKAVTMVVGS